MQRTRGVSTLPSIPPRILQGQGRLKVSHLTGVPSCTHSVTLSGKAVLGCGVIDMKKCRDAGSSSGVALPPSCRGGRSRK